MIRYRSKVEHLLRSYQTKRGSKTRSKRPPISTESRQAASEAHSRPQNLTRAGSRKKSKKAHPVVNISAQKSITAHEKRNSSKRN